MNETRVQRSQDGRVTDGMHSQSYRSVNYTHTGTSAQLRMYILLSHVEGQQVWAGFQHGRRDPERIIPNVKVM